MKPVLSILFVLGVAAMVSCSEDSQVLSSAGDKEMWTKKYLVAPDFQDDPKTSTTSADPFNNGIRTRSALESFEAAGITFPEGSGFYPGNSFSGFTVTNTRENIQKIEAWLDREVGTDNWQPYPDDAVGPIDPNADTQTQP